jgi:hypothetical protein
MNITNDRNVIVYKNKYGKYSVMISKKNMDGEYENAFIPIQFNKEVELENKTQIKIVNAWLSFYELTKEDGTTETRFFIRCSDFKEIPNDLDKLTTKTETQTQFDYSDSDLPF